MKSPFGSKTRSDPIRRRIDMAVAVAEEKLLATHAARALDMIERVRGGVPFDDVLDIYSRLLRLSPDESRALKTRAMAELGQRDGHERSWLDTVEHEGDDEDDDADERSLLDELRRRLRGRIDEDLRFVIELEAARAEEALLFRHVANALHFVDLLDGATPAPEAVDLYIDALDVRESMAEVVYHLALSRLADRHFDDGGGAARQATASPSEAGEPADRPTIMRVAEPDDG